MISKRLDHHFFLWQVGWITISYFKLNIVLIHNDNQTFLYVTLITTNEQM